MLLKRFLKRDRERLVITTPSGDTAFSGDARDFILPEECVLRLSMEFFNDPAPCEIHRGAVRDRAFQEILLACGEGRKALQTIRPEIRSYLSGYATEGWAEVRREAV